MVSTRKKLACRIKGIYYSPAGKFMENNEAINLHDAFSGVDVNIYYHLPFREISLIIERNQELYTVATD
jgi:hypothetical protein